MNMSPEVRANWLMVKALCFPAAWVRWMLVVGVAFLLVGDFLVWKFDNNIALYIGSSLTFLYTFVVGMFLPSQMVTMATSKQFYWLKHVRQKLAIIMFISCFLVSLFTCIFLMFSEHNLQIINIFLAVFCVLSIVFAMTVVMAKFFGTGQFLVFIFSSLYMKLGQWLTNSSLLVSLALLVVVWSAFLFWWFTWKPKRFMKSYFGASQADFMDSYAAQNGYFNYTFNLCNAKPKTLMGSMLLGYADGWLSQVKRALSPFIVFAFILALATLMMGGDTFMKAMSMNMNFFLIFILVSFAFSFNLSLSRNLHKVWMFYDGARHSLPKYVESICFPLFFINVAVVLVVFFALVYLQVIPSVTVPAVLLMTISSCLVAAIALYVSIIVYCKTKASTTWSMWLNGFIYLFFIISFNGFAKYLDVNSHIVVALSVGLSGALLTLILRQWMLALWRNADMLRGVN